MKAYIANRIDVRVCLDIEYNVGKTIILTIPQSSPPVMGGLWHCFSQIIAM